MISLDKTDHTINDCNAKIGLKFAPYNSLLDEYLSDVFLFWVLIHQHNQYVDMQSVSKKLRILYYIPLNKCLVKESV